MLFIVYIVLIFFTSLSEDGKCLQCLSLSLTLSNNVRHKVTEGGENSFSSGS